MKPEKTRSKLFNRRAALLLGGKMLLLGGLGARLYYLQVVESERYKMLAEENRINFRLLPPPRGFITDRNGDYLAINIQNYRLVLVPEQAKDAGGVEATLVKLSRLIDLPDHDLKRVLREVKRRRAFVPITVRENLSWEEVSRIGVNAPELPGVNIDVGQTRHYPYGPNMAHVIGYVGAVSEKELAASEDPLLELPGFRIGKNGIEKAYDQALRGTAGTSQVEVNALGRVIRELRRQEGQPGHEVRLTLDMRLQDFIGERLKGEKAASVVVMDVHTGAVRALVSIPSYDPNAFSEGLRTEEWRALVNNPYHPLTNKAIAGQYSPGSVFKMAVALAALENGVSRDHRVFCPGHMELGDRRFHCWKRWGHGEMDMVSAIEESCDVWFYDVARRVGVDRIAAMAKRLGLGERTGIDLVGERAGLIPTRAWKRAALGQPWHMGESLVVGIGQGYVLTTPLQLAVSTARLVNGGKAVTPHLTLNHYDGAVVRSRERTAFPDVGIPEAHLAVMREAMDAAVNGERGTARASRLRGVEAEMGGKTGTSQVRRITQAERDAGLRDDDEIAWRLRDHALFAGYAPAHDPRYVVSVVVEHGGGGSTAAAPIARDVLEEVLRIEGRAISDAGDAPDLPARGEGAG